MDLEFWVHMIPIFIVIEAIIFLANFNFDLSLFNPIRNYKKWNKINWFGISIITLLLNIICIPYAIGYWIYKSFTIGRK